MAIDTRQQHLHTRLGSGVNHMNSMQKQVVIVMLIALAIAAVCVVWLTRRTRPFSAECNTLLMTLVQEIKSAELLKSEGRRVLSTDEMSDILADVGRRWSQTSGECHGDKLCFDVNPASWSLVSNLGGSSPVIVVIKKSQSKYDLLSISAARQIDYRRIDVSNIEREVPWIRRAGVWSAGGVEVQDLMKELR